MRKILFSAVLFITAASLINSCKKQDLKTNKITQIDQELITKVNSWLDQQKPVGKPNKTANVELLKQNLDFSLVRFEDMDQDKEFLVIPINENFKKQRNVDNNTVLQLVLLLDKSGNITKGDMIFYEPEVGKPIAKLPNNTISKMYTNKDLDCSGTFKVLSPTGMLCYSIGIKDGKFNSFGRLKTEAIASSVNNSGPSANRTNMDCYDVYAATDWYYGSTYMGTTYDYISSFCVGCDDQNMQAICPDNEQGSPGGNSNLEYEYEISKTVAWHVHNTTGGPLAPSGAGTGVNSIERIKGKRSSSDPNGGYFTDIFHFDSECNDCDDPSDPTHCYVEVSNSVSYSANQATSSVTGHYDMGSTRIDVSRSKSWSFQEIFP